MTRARKTMMDPAVVGTYHCMSRCVRRAFLCGIDPKTNRNYDYRKVWLEQRLAELAGIFLIDVIGYAIMSNHLHAILRNRPDLAKICSDREIVLRWRRLCPLRRTPDGLPGEPTEVEIETMLSDKQKVAKWRARLANISWFMAYWKQPIAKRANIEDNIGGHFWEGRYKSIVLLDQAALLACLIYVDLNPIRAGIADTPEGSNFTSVRRRILAYRSKKSRKSRRVSNNQWLCPMRDTKHRSGFLQISLPNYLELLDWSGRHMASEGKGSIPKHLEPILVRLKIKPNKWHLACRNFGSMFYRAAGTLSSMVTAARVAGQHWFKGKGASKIAFFPG